MTGSRRLLRGAITIVVSALLLVIEPMDVSAQGDDKEAVRTLAESFLTALGEGKLDVLPEMMAFVPTIPP